MIPVSEVAKLVGGAVEGNPSVMVKGMTSPEFAQEGDMTFVADKDGIEKAEKSAAGVIITTLDIPSSKTVLKVKDIKLALTVIYNAILAMPRPGTGFKHPTAIVSDSAKIGKGVVIGPYAIVGNNTVIGENSTIEAHAVIGDNVAIGAKTRICPNVTIYEKNFIGNNVTIHAGSVIGADGFGYVPKGDKIYKVPQLGSVIIEDDVEIGANTCVDRGTFTTTVIGKGTKLDNLIQIAHNVKLGRNVLMAAQCGIAGSCKIGDNVMMAGQVGISDHITIHNGTKMGGQAGVTKDTEKDNEVLAGYPARDARTSMKQLAFGNLLFKNAHKIMKILKNLE
jgi:UDP-3-O-[3-hydroxymyristoyl] glucosamine N-acyltransferase